MPVFFYLQKVEAMGSIAPHEEDDSSVKPAEDGNNIMFVAEFGTGMSKSEFTHTGSSILLCEPRPILRTSYWANVWWL